MFNGKLYCVRTGVDLPLSFTVYSDDAEAVSSFSKLINIIRKDIASGSIVDGTDFLLSLYCYAVLKDGVIYGLKEPIFLISGDEVSDDSTFGDDDLLVPSLTESEVSK